MYAVVEIGGKQFRVTEGQEIFAEKLDANVGDVISFDQVLMVGGEKTVIGTPVINGASVTAKVVKQGKHKKIIVFKYKPKKKYRKKQGHRQPYTKLLIETITG